LEAQPVDDRQARPHAWASIQRIFLQRAGLEIQHPQSAARADHIHCEIHLRFVGTED
jgi:hypothetical protein